MNEKPSVWLRILRPVGVQVPGFVVRAAVAVVGAPLCFVCYQPAFWITVGLVLAGLAVIYPQRLAAWVLILFLGASRLPHHSSPLQWQFFVLLAGLHLLHLLAAQTLEFPWRGSVQLAVFRRPLLRFLAIQIPVQALAVVALAVLAPRPNGSRHVTLAAFGIVGALALVMVTLALAVPLLREKAR
jgi:hypothetical protein